MFSPNEVEKYQHIKVSDELKEQIIKKVDNTHKHNQKIAIRLAAATACMILVVLGLNMYMIRNHVLSIDGVPVLYNARTIHNTSSYSIANVKQEEPLLMCVPIEVRVYDEASITVTEGTLSTDGLDQQSAQICISRPEDIIWYISPQKANCAQCVILTENKKYVYELLFQEKTENYTIRQLKNFSKGDNQK